MRLDKFICKSTSLTKNQAIEFINRGRVLVNDMVVVVESAQVHENNTVALDNKVLTLRPFRYLLIHKPANTLCSNVDENYPSLLNMIDIEKPEELHIAGRLDADTTGLVLVTDDGRWSFEITRPEKQCRKVYRVQLSKPIAPTASTDFSNGILLQGEQKPTRPAQLEIISEREILLTITEGKYHQVKRMFKAIGNRVVALHREKVGQVTLDIPEGQWRHLTHKEVSSFNLNKKIMTL